MNNISEERQKIILEVLQRTDEICPAEDINLTEGELVDSVLDNALNEFLLIANVHKIPCIKGITLPNTEKVNEDGTTETEPSTVYNDVVDGRFATPDDYVRLVSIECPDWARVLYESDLMDTSSLAWKLSSFKFNEPTRMRPMIATLPMVDPKGGERKGGNFIHVAPYKGNGLTMKYVYRLKPEELKENVGADNPFWQAYVWYASATVMTVRGEAAFAAVAMQHAEAYQIIPNGHGGMAQDKGKD